MNKFIAAEAAECIGCHACEIACAVAHNQENWPLSHSDFRPRIHVVGKGQAANPVACHHCNNAPCVTACPVNALTFQSDSVQLDEQKCIGCKRCAIACPFGVVEMVDTIAQKCDLCNQRSSGTQACIEVCPTQALRLMDDKGLQQIKVARQRKTAAGKASSDAQPSRSAALLPVNSRTEMAVKMTPIRNTAPSATGTLICCPSTRLNAVNAVKEIAQPIAIGKLAHNPISNEPKPATRQVATNTAAGGKPALPSIPGTTITE